MAKFDPSHGSTTELIAGALPSIDLPSIDFPPVALPDALNSLGMFASQLQTVIAAALSHPFWAIGIVIVSIGLLQLVADLVKRILKAGLKLILTLPLQLSQWLWKQATAPSATKVNEKARITQLLNQLDTLRTEQNEVIEELKGLLQSSATIDEATATKAAITNTNQQQPSANPEQPALQSSAESPPS